MYQIQSMLCKCKIKSVAYFFTFIAHIHSTNNKCHCTFIQNIYTLFHTIGYSTYLDMHGFHY